MEKEQRLREMQKIMGMRMRAYYCVTLGLNLALYLAVAAAFYVAGVAAQLRFFVQVRAARVHVRGSGAPHSRPPQTNFWTLSLLLLGWGLCLVSFALLISAFLRCGSATRARRPTCRLTRRCALVPWPARAAWPPWWVM